MAQTETATKPMRNWGDLNIALNGLVREKVIAGYQTNRAEKGDEPSVVVTVASGADQAEVVARVRAVLTGMFENATVRTKQG